MRILLVSAHGPDPGYGGAERYIRDLASGLDARGSTVEVLSAFPQRRESDIETHVLYKTDWRDHPLRRLRNHIGDVVSEPWPRLNSILQDARPNLVHTNNLPGIGTGVWEAARRAGIPVVHTLHDYYLLCPRTTLTRRNGAPCNPHPLLCGVRARRLARWQGGVRTIIAVSDHVLRVHEELFPDAIKRVVRPPLTKLCGSPPSKTPPETLGYLGSLTTVKGIRLLLEAAPMLARHGMTLRVAGDGPLRREVEASEHVHYEGHLQGEEVGRFMCSCDVGLVPSIWDEPGAYVVREWVGSGRPVLSTRRGDLVESERGGGVKNFDQLPDAFVDAVLRLRDPARWERLLATLPEVDGDADRQRWLDDHEAAYEAALSAQSDRRAND